MTGVPQIREMKNVTATANEPLSIRCYVTGYPVETILWWKGRQQTITFTVSNINNKKQNSLTDQGEK